MTAWLNKLEISCAGNSKVMQAWALLAATIFFCFFPSKPLLIEPVYLPIIFMGKEVHVLNYLKVHNAELLLAHNTVRWSELFLIFIKTRADITQGRWWWIIHVGLHGLKRRLIIISCVVSHGAWYLVWCQKFYFSRMCHSKTLEKHITWR